MKNPMWKVSTDYRRAQKNKADIVLWDDQKQFVAKNIKYGDAALIVDAVNFYFKSHHGDPDA